MKILQFPHPSLLEPCNDVYSFNGYIERLLGNMWNIMKENHGMGLAANQVDIPLNMFVMEGPEGRIDFINPYIASQSDVPANLNEGCLSAPGESFIVPGRASWVYIKYQDVKGQAKSVVLKGIYAVCAQHEIEHLQGESFLNHASLPKAIRKKNSKKWGLK